MRIFTPVQKVALGLTMLALCMLMMAELVGFIPSEHRGFLEGRKRLCESLAIQFSSALTSGDIELVRRTLDSMVQRDRDVLSAAIVGSNGQQVLQTGRHTERWKDFVKGESTATHVQVPIFENGAQWGFVQVAFAELPKSSIPLSYGFPLLALMLFMTVACFGSFLWFIKRTLRELDPRGVIPERVKSAFDTLAEGLVIVDERQNIILANAAWCQRLQTSQDDLLGRKLSDFEWQIEGGQPPWEQALAGNKRRTATLVRFAARHGGLRTFTVNATPITDAQGKVKGAVSTFNDLTDLERKQVELRNTVQALQKSRQELQDKAVELEFLATRDALTGCLNRRAFFERAGEMFDVAAQGNKPLACIMTDIDHFKSINDTHGHGMGDKVIQVVAGELRANARPDDITGRYGGEEFCVILPGVEVEAAVLIAERLRASIKDVAKKQFGDIMRVTASFGVAIRDAATVDPAELISLADKALYIAKENGRNRVVSWAGDEDESIAIADAMQAARTEVTDEIPSAAPVVRPNDDVANQDEVETLRSRLAALEQKLLDVNESNSTAMGHDAVTGLPNRMLLIDRIRQAAARSERLDRIAAVVVLDIDLFRRINDALGFVIGDKVLLQAGQRLDAVLRGSDTVALLGGKGTDTMVSRTGSDEFGILLNDIENADSVTWVVKRLIDNLSLPLSIDGNEIHLSCSAGISLFPHDGSEPEQLLARANAAKHTAKGRLGRNNFAFYAADLDQLSSRHLWMEGQLHNALKNNELSLQYQPKLDLATGRISSLEGLLRWNSAKLGRVSPADFIPVAEQTGLINEIGRWVIRAGCEQARRWADAGFADVGVAINLSALQFREQDLFENTERALRESGLAPGTLELEVTESVIMENLSDAVATLNRLASAGVRLTIDDFGTGYSSLAYLKNLPVETLKIDRSFLSDAAPDEQDQRIIAAIIAMAHSMKMKVVAEGVETEPQCDFLKRLNCDEIQGYLFSRPVDPDEALELLKIHNAVTPPAARSAATA